MDVANAVRKKSCAITVITAYLIAAALLALLMPMSSA